ncbi:hypothetical protein GBF38_021839 [Nibea albiflora]|uniref:Uncharacterized protein n=1 Tax=Nibea albiflora TaxID=240163 RepID=A0ACB7FK41_NIBAL|nr:hypothetical protein GBF38_021839 [Nibea albiflora]
MEKPQFLLRRLNLCESITQAQNFTFMQTRGLQPGVRDRKGGPQSRADRKPSTECFTRLPEDVTIPANISSRAKSDTLTQSDPRASRQEGKR